MSSRAASPNKTRARIVEILDDSAQRALGLKECLENERKALEQQDADTLSAVLESKALCLNELHLLENERSRVGEASGFGPGPQQMAQLQEWCDANSVIANGWQNLMQIVTTCNDLNMSNGAIIRVRKQQIDTNLSIIRGGSSDADTYGRNGTESAGQRQRSLAEA